MCFFSPQIRFFAKTYTLTPYNGAEAQVSSSQLDFNISSFWVPLPESAGQSKEPLSEAGGWVLFPPVSSLQQRVLGDWLGLGLICQVMLYDLRQVPMKEIVLLPLSQGDCCSPWWQSSSHRRAGTGDGGGSCRIQCVSCTVVGKLSHVELLYWFSTGT